MPLSTRKRIFSGFFLFILLLGAWLYFQRFTRVALENYVPTTALGYVEVNDVPGLLKQFATTQAWQELAPLYGLQNALHYAGWANWWGRWVGIGTKESLLMARGQFALVVSGIEMRGEEVKPRWALIIETHRSEASVKSLMAAHLPELAQRALQQTVQEASEYSGVPITIFRAPNTDRQLLSASYGSTWLLANDAATLQACLDVRQGRVAPLAQNPLLAQAKAEVDQSGAVFAFISNDGAARLSQFFTHLLIGKTLAGTPLAGMPEGVMSEISENTVEAMAYSASFADGGVVDRYAIVCKPEVAQSLQTALRAPGNSAPEKSEALKFVPADAQEVTLVTLTDPGQALDGIERIVSGHLGVAQSFLFHKFFTSARKTFLGLEPGENPSTAVGSEVVRFGLEAGDDLDRVWMVAARNRQQLTQLAERLLRQQDLNVGRIKLQNAELTSNGKRAFAWLGNYLVLGNTEHVMRLLEEQGKTNSLLTAPPFTAAERPALKDKTVMHSFHSVADDTQEMMTALARRLRGNPQANAQIVLERLPWAAAVTALTERGVVCESLSPVGNFPMIVNFVDSVF
ncbi:MAG TPA: hypothetical protein VFZ34_06170 [Blastocatellia bacterium]|nr:hypothetical protein [Blastocatellia bacterium]